MCILGCGRSGTSIFGELFQTLPAYQYHSEPEWREFTSIDFSSPVAVKVPRPRPGGTSNRGLPFHPEDFHQVFPTTGMLFWKVRHPLDAICSLKIGIAKNWGHHPQPHDYQQWLDRSLAEQCAHHWNYINTLGYRQLAGEVVVKKFEDMIMDPIQFATSCLEQCNLDWKTNQRAVETWADRVQDSNNKKFEEAECSRPYSTNDHKKKVGRWKENLTRDEMNLVLPIVAEGARLFGYELDGI